MTQTDKKCFRDSKAWKEFRTKLGSERKVDEVTNKPLRSGWNLHHLSMADDTYTDLSDESSFACLNKQTHEVVHWLFRYWTKDPDVINRLEQLLQRMNK